MVKRKTVRTKKPKNKTVKGGIFGLFSSKPKSKYMKYPFVKLSYGQKEIKCEICGWSIFYKIRTSINRSKEAGIFLEDLEGIVNHPTNMYTCLNCSNCKFFYEANTYNGIKQKVIEKVVTLKE